MFKVSIHFIPPDQDWPILVTQTFNSLQHAMKDGPPLIQKTRRKHGLKGRVIKYCVEEMI